MHWSCQAEEAPWPARSRFGATALPGGAVLLLGGLVGPRNDVWRSADGGVAWERLAYTAPWSARWGPGLAALSSGAVALLGGISSDGQDLNDVWLSEDQGSSWQRVTEEAPWQPRVGHGVVALPKGALLLMGGMGAKEGQLNDVWRSDDGAANWERLHAEAPWCRRCWFGAAALSDGTVLLLGGLGTGNQLLNDVWRSADGGSTWECLTAEAPWPPRRGHGMVALPSGALLVLGGLASGASLSDVWRSSDGGTGWEQLEEAAAWSARIDPGVVALPNGAVLLLGGQDRAIDSNRNDIWRADPVGVPPACESESFVCVPAPALKTMLGDPATTQHSGMWKTPQEQGSPSPTTPSSARPAEVATPTPTMQAERVPSIEQTHRLSCPQFVEIRFSAVCGENRVLQDEVEEEVARRPDDFSCLCVEAIPADWPRARATWRPTPRTKVSM
mmetsp:Transcript_102866/g.331877  ORF Transcript_102866/g.331877 Transcript_102866/m.331877 type:complete len:445 (-) Transcript_102866:343-1677(-)